MNNYPKICPDCGLPIVLQGQGYVGAKLAPSPSRVHSLMRPAPATRPVGGAAVWDMRNAPNKPVCVYYPAGGPTEGRFTRAMCVGSLKLIDVYEVCCRVLVYESSFPTVTQAIRKIWPTPADCIRAFAESVGNGRMPNGNMAIEPNGTDYVAQQQQWCLNNNTSQWMAEHAEYAIFSKWISSVVLQWYHANGYPPPSVTV